MESKVTDQVVRLKFVGKSIKGAHGKSYRFATGNKLSEWIFIPQKIVTQFELKFEELQDNRKLPVMEFNVPLWYFSKNTELLSSHVVLAAA